MTTRTGLRQSVNRNGNASLELITNDDHSHLPVEALKTLHSFRPDLVDKAVAMAEAEQQKRHEYLNSIIKDHYSARRYAFALAVLSIIACCVLAFLGHTTPAIAVCGLPVASMVASMFIKR